MKSDVRHDESWLVTVHREEDSDWPDKIIVNPLSSRWMKPDTVSFLVRAGYEQPDKVEVYGLYLDGPNQGKVTQSRYHQRRIPDWLATIIEDARQHWHLTPAEVVADWPDGPLAVRLRRLIAKWASLARHPSRQGTEGEGPAGRIVFERCARDLQDELTAWRTGRSQTARE